MTKIVHGVVQGKTIRFDQDLGIDEGQEVEVQVRTVTSPTAWGDGLRRCAGAMADVWSEEDDRILAEIHESRHRDTRKEIPE
ncbi:MAG: hypothetical protein HYZ53_08560 [Planctomycetes bacterium]|nr:hypothetical protein [Planctomycetota bacterium]